ncbi:uncharacterized protein LOC121395477 [Xenopus laevis]|uniref:Uncharacterized protein LOC121395477 n=1 Tax=Xenopus laevis TaxID=8355 RepID=A0A8J1L605_XENLA|nr:uncharacterized protein LOC121395477 [Xenopus laevis]
MLSRYFITPTIWTCVDCTSKFRKAIERFRKYDLPWRVNDAEIGLRCSLLMMRMESTYFQQYAVNQYSGFIDPQDLAVIVQKAMDKLPDVLNFNGSDSEFLDNLANFGKEIILEMKPALKKAQDLVCSPSECENLKEMVDCGQCKIVFKSLCLVGDACAVNREKRVLMETTDIEETGKKLKLIALVTATVIGIIFLVLLITIAVVYSLYTKKERETYTVEDV